jgi:hypothetical protein
MSAQAFDFKDGAGEGNRTLVISLEEFCSSGRPAASAGPKISGNTATRTTRVSCMVHACSPGDLSIIPPWGPPGAVYSLRTTTKGPTAPLGLHEEAENTAALTMVARDAATVDRLGRAHVRIRVDTCAPEAEATEKFNGIWTRGSCINTAAGRRIPRGLGWKVALPCIEQRALRARHAQPLGPLGLEVFEAVSLVGLRPPARRDVADVLEKITAVA